MKSIRRLIRTRVDILSVIIFENSILESASRIHFQHSFIIFTNVFQFFKRAFYTISRKRVEIILNASFICDIEKRLIDTQRRQIQATKAVVSPLEPRHFSQLNFFTELGSSNLEENEHDVVDKISDARN